MTKKLIMMALTAACLPMAVSADVLLTDDFESYADQAALEASWLPYLAGVPGGTNWGVLTTNAGQGANGSNKYLVMPSDYAPVSTGTDPTLSKTLSLTHTPSDADKLHLTIYLRAAGWAGNRFQVSTRNLGQSAIMSIGAHNAASSNGTGSENKFVARAVGFSPAPANTYTHLLSGGDKTINIWHKLEAHAGSTALTYEVDDFACSESITYTTPGSNFAIARFGAGNSANTICEADSIEVAKDSVSHVSDWDLY